MLEEFKNYLTINMTSKKSVTTYIALLKSYLNKYGKVNQNYINSFLTDLIENGKSEQTFNVYLAMFKMYSKFKGLDLILPKSKKVIRKKKVSLTKEEIENEILPYFNIMFQDPEKRKLVFKFMMLTCMRISEVVKLKKEHIDFKNRKIYIVGAKGNKNRTTYIHLDILNDFKKEVDNSPNEYALNINELYIRWMFEQINTQLNYKKHLTPHVLRHAGAKFLYDNGVNIKMLQEMLGHSNLNTTDIYLDYDDDEIQRAFDLTKFK